MHPHGIVVSITRRGRTHWQPLCSSQYGNEATLGYRAALSYLIEPPHLPQPASGIQSSRMYPTIKPMHASYSFYLSSPAGYTPLDMFTGCRRRREERDSRPIVPAFGSLVALYIADCMASVQVSPLSRPLLPW